MAKVIGRLLARAAPVVRYVPGLITAGLVAAAARLLSVLGMPSWISEVAVAVLLGIALGAIAHRANGLEPGVRFASTRLLRSGVVLVGVQLSLTSVAATGALAVLVVVGLMAIAFLAATVAGRLMHIPPRLSFLIAIGTAVCGNTAIVSAAPLIGAKQREVSYAVSVITLFGTVALFVYPLIGLSLGLDPTQFGFWAGSAINDTSQVVAAGSAFGGGALAIATLVKLTRNTLMLPILVWLSFTNRSQGTVVPIWRAVPLFVVGFVIMALARSVGIVDAQAAEVMLAIARSLILVALAAVGLGTPLLELRRVGAQPLIVGFLVATLIGTVALFTSSVIV